MRAVGVVVCACVLAVVPVACSGSSSVATVDGGAEAALPDGATVDARADAAGDASHDGSTDAPSDGQADAQGDGAGDVATESQSDAPSDASGDVPSEAGSDGAADAAACGAPGIPVLLASGLGTPFWLAIDSTRIYWTATNGGQVTECLIGDCCSTPTVLATSQVYPSGVAVGAGTVYWINQGPSGPGTGSIASCPTSGCNGTPTTLSTGQGGLDIAFAGTRLFWSNNYQSPGPPGAGLLMTCSLAGGCMQTTTPFVSSSNSDAGVPIQPIGIAVDATNVYWGDYGTGWVMAANQTGGPLRTLATGQTLVRDIAVDATNVYWVTYQPLTVMKCPIAGCNNSPTMLFADPIDNGNGITVDATDVYFTGSNALKRCAIAGCNGVPTTITQDPTWSLTEVAVDATHVFWLVAEQSHAMGSGELVMLTK